MYLLGLPFRYLNPTISFVYEQRIDARHYHDITIKEDVYATTPKSIAWDKRAPFAIKVWLYDTTFHCYLPVFYQNLDELESKDKAWLLQVCVDTLVYIDSSLNVDYRRYTPFYASLALQSLRLDIHPYLMSELFEIVESA